ncbi:MAG: protein kinase [Chloroflexi bacterium]|nr:protein kinase [Chloroflexota bacterium]
MLELAPGTALGPYVIVARLGRGGMATVYRAHHSALDRDVAIKVLWPNLADSPGFIERFRREARIVSRLRHPNILTVYDFGEQAGLTFMVTELLPGGALSDRLGRPLPLDVVGRVLHGIGAALDVAHAAGLVHRDVKPSNILFTGHDEPVLADFGIARLLEGDEHLTLQGTFVGTPHYVAPEMAASEPVGPASDLYSLGVVLYEMLTGGPPFPRETPIATIRAHIYDQPEPARHRNPAVPAELEPVIARALAKSPADRFPSGAALAGAFDDALLAAEEPTPQPGSTLWLPPSAPDAHTRNLPRSKAVAAPAQARPIWPFALLGVLTLAFVAGGLTFLWRSSAAAGTGVTPTPAPTRIVVGGIPGSPVASPTPPPTVVPSDIAASATQTAAAPRQSPAATPEPSPTAAPVAVTLPPRPSPAVTIATATPVPLPRQTPNPLRGPLAVQITSPTNGATVPARPRIDARRTGLQGPDEHLWLLIHPLGGPDNWWPYQHELIANRDGTLDVTDAEIGGTPGSHHILAIGVVDADGDKAIRQQVAQHPGEPFVGQPPGFNELARVQVTRGP